jgi:hypothetical protein
MYISPLTVPVLLLGPGDADFPALGLGAYQQISIPFSRLHRKTWEVYIPLEWVEHQHVGSLSWLESVH